MNNPNLFRKNSGTQQEKFDQDEIRPTRNIVGSYSTCGTAEADTHNTLINTSVKS